MTKVERFNLSGRYADNTPYTRIVEQVWVKIDGTDVWVLARTVDL